MQQRSLQQVRVSVSLIFLIHGLIIATWASRIPAFQAHLHLSPAVLGRSLMMAAIGSVFAMRAAGWLIKFGSLSIVIAAGLVFVLLFGNAGWALVGFTCAGAGLATIIPNTFAAAVNIEGSAPGPSLAVVTTGGYVGFLAGPPLIGFVAQLSTIRAALWILVVLSGLSAFASTSMKRTSPLRRIP